MSCMGLADQVGPVPAAPRLVALLIVRRGADIIVVAVETIVLGRGPQRIEGAKAQLRQVITVGLRRDGHDDVTRRIAVFDPTSQVAA